MDNVIDDVVRLANRIVENHECVPYAIYEQKCKARCRIWAVFPCLKKHPLSDKGYRVREYDGKHEAQKFRDPVTTSKDSIICTIHV